MTGAGGAGKRLVPGGCVGRGVDERPAARGLGRLCDDGGGGGGGGGGGPIVVGGTHCGRLRMGDLATGEPGRQVRDLPRGAGVDARDGRGGVPSRCGGCRPVRCGAAVGLGVGKAGRRATDHADGPRVGRRDGGRRGSRADRARWRSGGPVLGRVSRRRRTPRRCCRTGTWSWSAQVRSGCWPAVERRLPRTSWTARIPHMIFTRPPQEPPGPHTSGL